MPYIGRSVTDGVSLSVIQSKLAYSSQIFVDNKLTLICLLTQQQLAKFLSVTHKLFCLSDEFCIFENKRVRRMGCMTQSIILPVILPNVHRFLPRDAMHPRYCHGPVSVRLSVCLSVRPSQVSVLLKRLNVGSHKEHHIRYPKDSSFLKPKISAKFDRGHPLRGRRMQVGQ